MFRNAYQRGMLTVFFSGGSKPFNIWEVRTQDGYISRFLDQDIKSLVIEIGGSNVSTTYMTCPKGKAVLGITMPFLVMVVKNLKKYFSFEVTILDETGTRRRFRVSNFQSSTQILPLCTVMPIGLSEGWNQIQFNLAEFTRRAYKKQFVEVQKLKINANIRVRRIYFAERLLPEEQLPPEYKLFFPLTSKGAKSKKAPEELSGKENVKPSTSQQTVGAIAENKSSKELIKIPSQETPKEEVTAAPATPVEQPSEEFVAESAENVEAPKTEIEGSTAPEGTETTEGGEVPFEESEALASEVTATETATDITPADEAPANEDPGGEVAGDDVPRDEVPAREAPPSGEEPQPIEEPSVTTEVAE